MIGRYALHLTGHQKHDRWPSPRRWDCPRSEHHQHGHGLTPFANAHRHGPGTPVESQGPASARLPIFKGRKWCCKRGLNSRPLPYQGSALPLSYCSAVGGGGDRRCPQPAQPPFRPARAPALDRRPGLGYSALHARSRPEARPRQPPQTRRCNDAGRPAEGGAQGQHGAAQGTGEGTGGRSRRQREQVRRAWIPFWSRATAR